MAFRATFVFILSAVPVTMFVPAFSRVVSVEPERSAESNPSKPVPTQRKLCWCLVAVNRSYEEELKVLGEILEAEQISSFELTCLPECYLIQGGHCQSGSLNNKLSAWLRLSRGSDSYSLTLSLAEINKRYHAELAEPSIPVQLDNFRTTSNVLRTVGAYLDSKQAELFELKMRPISLSLWYRDKTGYEQQEDRAVSSFHNLFLNVRKKIIRTTEMPRHRAKGARDNLVSCVVEHVHS